MELSYFGTLAVAVFVLQFILCMKKARLLFRLLPTVVLAAGLAVCGIVYAVGRGTAFSASVCGVILAVLLVLDGLGWLAALLVAYRK